MKRSLERDVEKYFLRRAWQRGVETRKLQWIGRAHGPDRLLLLPNCHIFVELKALGKKAREGQAREHCRMRKADCTVFVIDSIASVDRLFDSIDELE